MKKTITLLMLLALVMPLWAGEQTITITRNDEFVTGQGDFTIRKGGVTVTIGGTLNNPNFIQLSQQKTITFRSANFAIKGIIFHCLDNYTEYVQDDVFYWGPSTLHVIKNTALGTIPGKYTPVPNKTSYDPNSTYNGHWVSQFSGTWTSDAGTHTSYADGFPAGNTLTFEASAKPIRFSSIEIVIEKESGDIYELVRNTSQIQTGINYMLVGRANNTTQKGRALSIYNTDSNNPAAGNIKSTYVDLLDNGLRVKANDSVQFIHLGDAISHGNNATTTGAQDYKWYIQTDAQNSIRTGSSTTTGDNATANYNKGYQLLKESTPTSTSSGRWRFYTSFNINGDENSANNYDNDVVIKFFTGYGGGSNYDFSNQQIRHNNDYGVFRNITNNSSIRQKVYLYQPATSYKVKAEVGTGTNTGTVSLRDGVILNNNVYWSQMCENVSFLANAANGYKVSSITIQKTDENFNVLASEDMINITSSVTTTNGTLYFFEMPASHVLITVNYEPVTYHNVNIVVKPNVAYGNVFLTEGYVVQQDQVKSYDGETVVFNVTPNPKDPDNENSEYYELYSVVVKNDITGEEIPYTYADGNYTFTMPDANVTITATFIYENGAPLYLLGTANGNETWLPYGPRFNYDPNEGQYYLDVYFKGIGEYGDTENYDQYGYFSFVWKYATSWDEINNKNLRGVPMTNGTMVNTSSDGFQLFYNPRNNANESNSFKILAGIYRFYVKSYSEGNDWLYVTQSPISLTYNPAGGADATSAVEVPQHQLVTMSGDLYSKIKAINPDESDGNFKYKATIGGVTEPQTEIAGASTSNIATLDVVNDGETVTELAGTNYLGWIHADKTAYYKVINTPLNWIERNGEKGKTYTVADQLQGVYAKDGHLWCKDLGDISIVKTEPATGQNDYVSSTLNTDNHRFASNMRTGNWDQSNWVELDFTQLDLSQLGTTAALLAQSYVDKFITEGSVAGVYSDDVNYTITLNAVPTKGEGTSYMPNTYYTNNFIESNLAGVNNYYFLNPKVQEYAIITYAMWDVYNQIMVAPSISPFNGAAVLGRWDLNESGNELERLNAAAHATATANNEYEFHIIVQRANKSYGSAATTTQGVAGLKAETPTPKAGQTASAVIMAQPLDLQASSPLPTAISTVGTQAQAVSVEYVNVAGVRSSKPFSGVNIVVTHYTDGSTTTTKVIRK